jgi:hypothetical protein
MARLSYSKRKKLTASEFAEPKKRKYPLDTKNRAKNALSRVSQNGSPAEKAEIRRKVHSEYPSIRVSGLKKGKKKSTRKRVYGK